MKRCPDCAEEIQDAATRCRYCGSSLPLAGVLRVDRLPADVEVVESGRRYALGVVGESFAIWDLLEPEQPIERFGGDPGVRDTAVERYRVLERAARGRLPWIRVLQIVFVVSVVVWAVARAFVAITISWFVGGETAIDLYRVGQAVSEVAFVVWVGCLAPIGALWIGEVLRRRFAAR